MTATYTNNLVGMDPAAMEGYLGKKKDDYILNHELNIRAKVLEWAKGVGTDKLAENARGLAQLLDTLSDLKNLARDASGLPEEDQMTIHEKHFAPLQSVFETFHKSGGSFQSLYAGLGTYMKGAEKVIGQDIGALSRQVYQNPGYVNQVKAHLANEHGLDPEAIDDDALYQDMLKQGNRVLNFRRGQVPMVADKKAA